MSLYPKGHWRRLADPALTPASHLVNLTPDTLRAHLLLCARPDLPEKLVAWMVADTVRDSSAVTQSAKALHLLSRHSLSPAHLTALGMGLGEHEYNRRPLAQILTHPRATRAALASLCWSVSTAATASRRDETDTVLRRLLLDHDAFTRAGVALADEVRLRNRARAGHRHLEPHEYGRMLRRLWLVGPDALTFAIRAMATWDGSAADMVAAAAAVAERPAPTGARQGSVPPGPERGHA